MTDDDITRLVFVPPLVRLVCCPTIECCNRDTWTLTDACRAAVMREAELLETFLAIGALGPLAETERS